MNPAVDDVMAAVLSAAISAVHPEVGPGDPEDLNLDALLDGVGAALALLLAMRLEGSPAGEVFGACTFVGGQLARRVNRLLENPDVMRMALLEHGIARPAPN